MDTSKYINKPYSFVLIPERDGGVSASILEFPGYHSEGETVAEAYTNLIEAARSWMNGCLASGQEIPEPGSTVTVPKEKYEELEEKAWMYDNLNK